MAAAPCLYVEGSPLADEGVGFFLIERAPRPMEADVCLAVPARIVEIHGDTAVVDIDGVRREGNVSLICNPAVDDYVLIHAGFAIRKWSGDDIREFRAIMDEMKSLRR